MLVGTWSHQDNMLALLATRENAVNVVRDYDCLGAGQFLAHYLIPTLFRHSSMGLDDTTNIAFHVLKETKEYVDSCGGGSQLIVLGKDGKFSHVGYSARQRGEKMSEAYIEAIRRLLVCSADLNATDDDIKKEFDMAQLILSSSRENLKLEMASTLRTIQKLDAAMFERWIIRS